MQQSSMQSSSVTITTTAPTTPWPDTFMLTDTTTATACRHDRPSHTLTSPTTFHAPITP